MKYKFKLILVATAVTTCCAASLAYADWDPAGEAREQAQRKAAQQQEARKKAENDKIIAETKTKAMRAQLGKDAVGKSDADITRLYEEQLATQRKLAADPNSAVAGMRQAQAANPAQRAQQDAAMKGMTGKSMSDMSKMSNKEMEAFAAELEKKFGK